MLLGFKRQFEPYVLDGTKRHTLRSLRARPFRVGDRCDCYGDVRQKTEHLLGRWPCTNVEQVQIYRRGDGTLAIWFGKHELSVDEQDAFAWRDGFRAPGSSSSEQFRQFWLQHHADAHGNIDFEGQLIHWDYDHPVPKGRTRKAGG